MPSYFPEYDDLRLLPMLIVAQLMGKQRCHQWGHPHSRHRIQK